MHARCASVAPYRSFLEPRVDSFCEGASRIRANRRFEMSLGEADPEAVEAAGYDDAQPINVDVETPSCIGRLGRGWLCSYTSECGAKPRPSIRRCAEFALDWHTPCLLNTRIPAREDLNGSIHTRIGRAGFVHENHS